ncbi:hypothetical protein [Armatimonas rosea]|uniref:Putative transcriptional regulator n=1 Tax=Armatimonas rosea TaxID=685828 RepID=A0A7W9SR58_ARMRO|nr:hypothetical protein [Armatimonas rosea]MBB6051261.1 putative transcriptional regulator [Armatimonas rosea]
MSVTLPRELEERLLRVSARRAVDPNHFATVAITQALEQAESEETMDSAMIARGAQALAQVAAGETLPLEDSFAKGAAELERRIAAWQAK